MKISVDAPGRVLIDGAIMYRPVVREFQLL